MSIRLTPPRYASQAEGRTSLQRPLDSTTRAGYFPGAQPIRIKMLTEKRTGRLLGAQIIGREGAAKRIDVLATAIWNEMGVDEILALDLSYAPPFAPVCAGIAFARSAVSGLPSRSGQLPIL